MNETIDKYLNNELTAEEKSAFEQTLLSDVKLRNDVESYKLIKSAYEREALKQDLQLVEQQIQSKKQRLKWTQMTTGTLAAAACIIIFVMVHVDTLRTMQTYAELHFSQTEELLFRGGSDVDRMILTACEQIANAEYKSAMNSLSSALEILSAELEILVAEQSQSTTPEGEYFAQMTTLKIHETQWLKAIAYMKNGNVRKAKRLLREISHSDSAYADDARNILKNKIN